MNVNGLRMFSLAGALGLGGCSAPVPTTAPTVPLPSISPLTQKKGVPAPSAGRCQAPSIELVTVGWNGEPANGVSYLEAISGTGRFVIFRSEANNLVPGDFNGQQDLFLRDRRHGVPELLKLRFRLSFPQFTRQAFSKDGRSLVFSTQIPTLVPGDTNESYDVFLRDMETGKITRISKGAEKGRGSYDPSISGDGRFVAYQSLDDKLVPGDGNGRNDIFLYDRETGTTERISAGLEGMKINARSLDPTINADGSFVAFETVVETEAGQGVFVYGRKQKTLQKIDPRTQGPYFVRPFLSRDGLSLFFESHKWYPFSDRANPYFTLFEHNLKSGETESILTAKREDIDYSISSDGRFVTIGRPIAPPKPFNRPVEEEVNVFVFDRRRKSSAAIGIGRRETFRHPWFSSRNYPLISADGCLVGFTAVTNQILILGVEQFFGR